MKRYRKVAVFITMIIIGYSTGLSGQYDTLKNYAIEKKHSYLDANFREETSSIKFGISPFYLGRWNDNPDYSDFNVELIFEKKINPSWSLITNLNVNYTGDFSKNSLWLFTNDIGVRYYYSMKKRISSFSGANNFNASYFSFVIKKMVELKYNNDEYSIWHDWHIAPDFYLGWGVQRHFKNWGFLDIGPYISYTRDIESSNIDRSLGIGVNFKFGLAYGWK